MAKNNGSSPNGDAAEPNDYLTGKHPAWVLASALRALSTMCSNHRLYGDLAERRRVARERQIHFMNLRSQAASERVNARIAKGVPFTEAFAAEADSLVTPAVYEPIPCTMPLAGRKHLTELLENGEFWEKRALDALRAGGATTLDALIAPNSAGQPRSIEIHTKLWKIGSCLPALKRAVNNPSFIMDGHVQEMAELGDWFEQVADELYAVIATRGLEDPSAPAGPPADAPADLKKLPTLGAHDRQAWQLSLLHGMTQSKIASTLNAEHGTNYTQGQVSRMIKHAKAHAEASGLAEKLPSIGKSNKRVVGLKNPDQGPRTDGRRPRASELDPWNKR